MPAYPVAVPPERRTLAVQRAFVLGAGPHRKRALRRRGKGHSRQLQQIPGAFAREPVLRGLQQAVLRSPLNPARPPVSAAFPEHLVEGIRAQSRINKKRTAQIPDQHAGHPALQKGHMPEQVFPGRLIV